MGAAVLVSCQCILLWEIAGKPFALFEDQQLCNRTGCHQVPDVSKSHEELMSKVRKMPVHACHNGLTAKLCSALLCVTMVHIL